MPKGKRKALNRPLGESYNPLDKLHLGESITKALLLKGIEPLSKTEDLVGAGVYAVYYIGSFAAYARIADSNRANEFGQPIYVGKAVPKGARKGGLTYDSSKGRALRDRLRQHATSINEALNLNIDDFYFRSLVVDDIWIPLGENMLIEQFHPVWNVVIDGFGNKDPGRRRKTQYRSSWDVLHPGRAFAVKLAEGETTSETLSKRLDDYLSGKTVPLIPADEAIDIGAQDDDDE
ncbi:MAG: Eco29kI family restriction endonuclease [Candidatus Binataceae bacterium]|nr:Eco29kI family restriction endonuclease [Candidatus Binataceae bacterium]